MRLKSICARREYDARAAGGVTVAIAGNPNVGKSTLFNALTGMNQHTGNWAGKTVSCARGFFASPGNSYILIDIPGAYSLSARSAEEEAARDFIAFGGADAVLAVCDATCLERNLFLVLQIARITKNVILCVNLMDEAEKKGIEIDLDELSRRLGIPVIGAVARDGKSLRSFGASLDKAIISLVSAAPVQAEYPPATREAADLIGEALKNLDLRGLDIDWLKYRLLESDESLMRSLEVYLGFDPREDPETAEAVTRAWDMLKAVGIDRDKLEYELASSVVKTSQSICEAAVKRRLKDGDALDRKIDSLLTGRLAGYPAMLALLALVMWLTIAGSNYPSEALSGLFLKGQRALLEAFGRVSAPSWLSGVLVEGVYRVATWVVAVMLPPMAIFFPLFTLLEDAGYLPRVAYNLDQPFKKCRACGKQALTMCMVCIILLYAPFDRWGAVFDRYAVYKA